MVPVKAVLVLTLVDSVECVVGTADGVREPALSSDLRADAKFWRSNVDGDTTSLALPLPSGRDGMFGPRTATLELYDSAGVEGGRRLECVFRFGSPGTASMKRIARPALRASHTKEFSGTAVWCCWFVGKGLRIRCHFSGSRIDSNS